MGRVDLGEKRRTARLIQLGGRLAERPESALNQAGGEWAETKAASCFFHNDTGEGQTLLAAHRAKTAERARHPRTVLALHAPSYRVSTSPRQTTGLGQLSLKKGKGVEKIHSRGLLRQSGRAVTTEGFPLGRLEQKLFAREAAARDRTEQRNVLPMEDKASSRWLAALKNSRPVRGNTQLVTGCAREAEIEDLCQLSAQLAAPVLVRAPYERPRNKRSLSAEKDSVKLWQQLAHQPGGGRFAGEIPARPGTTPPTPRAPRGATVEVRFVAFTLNRPTRLSATRPDRARSAIDVREQAPPADEHPLEWRLLTTLTLETFEQAYEKRQGDCLRGRIAMEHKVLNSGFPLEHCRPGAAQRLRRSGTVLSIIAWRLFLLTLLASTHPPALCPTLLTDQEWQGLSCKVNHPTTLPAKTPSLREVVLWIARLGGFLARKNDGQPGTIPLWRGWKRLTDFTQGWRLAAGGETCG